MDLFHAVILGAIQGITEFLPISSSGHLALMPWLFGWKDLGLTFDAALHLGTMIAILAYFWHDWIEIIKKWREPLLSLIIIGCIPAAIVGFLFEEYFETVFRSPLLIASFMMGAGFLLLAAEYFGGKKREISSVGFFDALIIGLAQMFALMPGVSRSGITMTAGLFQGMTREAAAKFSFLLATPITLGAGIFKIRHIIFHGLPNSQAQIFALGIITSAIVGFFAIRYLLKYLQRHSFYIFIWYRFLAGTAILLVYFLRG